MRSTSCECAGSTVFVLGGGPSLRRFDVSRLAGHHVIAINEAAFLARFADVLYFWDALWLERRRALVSAWSGQVVTPCRAVLQIRTDARIVSIAADAPLARGADTLRKGRSSGHQAVALAVAMGARRVVLLGYDMRAEGARTHFHDAYAEPREGAYADLFVPAFAGWRAMAEAAGATVVNATPGSALTEFPMVDIEDELTRG